MLSQGRFEVAIEVPPPRSISQRMSILNVHMRNMFRNGRLLVRDAPINSAAAVHLRNSQEGVLSYEELIRFIAEKSDKMSGASLAAITRAAASRALERAVFDFSDSLANEKTERSILSDCIVTLDDFERAVCDVLDSSKESDESETAV
jgi:SpoVK/Ycf46/Vps4 family AAA+-type ATPase